MGNFVRIFGNQRIAFGAHRSFNLKRFCRDNITSLRLSADFHYLDGYESKQARYVFLLDKFGAFLRSQGIIFQPRYLKILLLPMNSLKEKPLKRGKHWMQIDMSRLKPVPGQFYFPNLIFIAARPDKKMSSYFRNIFELQGEKAVIHEILHALTADVSDPDSLIAKTGVAVYDIEGVGVRRTAAGLNEGITEFVAHRFYSELTKTEIARAYDSVCEGLELLEQRIGLKPLLEALFANDLGPIAAALAQRGFPEDTMQKIIIAADADLAECEKKGLVFDPQRNLRNYILSCY